MHLGRAPGPIAFSCSTAGIVLPLHLTLKYTCTVGYGEKAMLECWFSDSTVAQ